MNSTGSVISMDTKDYKIDDYFGNWKVTDNIIIDGKQLYLLEHQEFREQAVRIILNSYEKFVTETGANYDMINGQVNNQKKATEKNTESGE